MKTEALQDEIQKRLTLNWLIQGASQHAGMTFHHFVRDELNAINPELIRLYDHFALINLLQYWHLSATIVFGRPSRFWKHAVWQPDHPFFGHELLSRYGGVLAEEGRKRGLKRSREKGLTRFPVAFSVQTVRCILRLRKLEAAHRPRLIQIAKRAASRVWGIPSERLHGEITDRIRIIPGDRIPLAQGLQSTIMRACIVGLGGVVQRGDGLIVVARGTNWLLLAKELVKGTAELICLHGLNQLSDDTYHQVIDATDRLDLEPWMLQSGGELWRRVLAAIPDELPVARLLMRLARLPPKALESTLAGVIEYPEHAQSRLAGLADETRT